MRGNERREARYRVSPNLIGYWKTGGLRLLNFATGYEVRSEPLVAQLLSNLGGWRTVAEVGRAAGITQRAPLQRLLERLVRASILHSSVRAPDPRDTAMAAWAPWNPAAGFFHAMSSGVTYVENDLPAAAKSKPRPCARPFVTGAGTTLPLEMPATSGAFPQVLLERRTWRQFADRNVSRASIEALLWLSAGVQGWLHTPKGERLPLTTSPSGGARHPIEVFALARHVDGLPSGLYKYDGVRHTLTSIGRPPVRVRSYLPRQYWYENAAFLIFLCGSFGKTLARYRYPRAYRAVLLEAGHVCQTFCLSATWLGLAPFCTMALDDRRINGDLGLDGLGTAVLYAAGVGVRTRTDVPAAPARQRGISVRPRRASKPR